LPHGETAGSKFITYIPATVTTKNDNRHRSLDEI